MEKVQQAVKCREAAEAEMARVRIIMRIKSHPLRKRNLAESEINQIFSELFNLLIR